MKKVFRRTSVLLAAAFLSTAAIQAQKSPQDMDRFIDALMKKMTVEEKIGQLNLPVSGEIVTGQAQNSDVAKKIEQGLVGGLLNLKGVVTPGHPPDIRHGRSAWLRNHFPYSIRPLLFLGYGSHQEICPRCSHRGQC